MSGSIRFITLIFLFQISHIGFAQIPDGYYNSTEGLTGEHLKSALHNIIKNHSEYPYTSSATDTWDIFKESDRDTVNPENVILFYSGWSVNAAQEYNNNTGWSREHVWAKSHGKFDTDEGVGTDAHNLRPTDITVNSARSNKDFDDGGSQYIDGDGPTDCYSDYDSWEPRDVIKGDVARMLLYMATRYEGENGEPDLELVDEVNTFDLNEPGNGFHGKLNTLLKWHNEDPVDSFEINRNDIIYSYQRNRNPLIDHPGFVRSIWNVATVSQTIKESGIRIYPNPAKDYVNIELQNSETAILKVYTVSGRMILETEVTGTYRISLENIKSGFYILSVETSKQVFKSKYLKSDI